MKDYQELIVKITWFSLDDAIRTSTVNENGSDNDGHWPGGTGSDGGWDRT